MALSLPQSSTFGGGILAFSWRNRYYPGGEKKTPMFGLEILRAPAMAILAARISETQDSGLKILVSTLRPHVAFDLPSIGTSRRFELPKAVESRSGCQADALKLHLGPTRHPVNSPWGHHALGRVPGRSSTAVPSKM